MGESKNEKCETCKFWRKINAYGECRRHAPIAFNYQDDLQTHWPETSVGMWCGEYKPKDEPNGRV
jgi:hypothetical protein